MAAIYGSISDIWDIKSLEVFAKVWDVSFENQETAIGLILSVISITFGLIVGSLTTVANMIVMAALWKDPYKQLRSSPSNIIIGSMAFCDFLIGFVSTAFVIFHVFRLVIGSSELIVQLSFVALMMALIGLSVLHVFALTVDRLIAVVRPLRYKSYITKRRTLGCILFMWISNLISSILTLPLVHYYFIFSFSFFLFFNIVILTTSILSILIIYRIRKPNHQLFNGTVQNSKTIMSRSVKATKSVIFIVVIFEACFTPFSVCWMVVITCASCKSHSDKLLIAYLFSTFMMIFNSCLNPFLYAFRLPKFKRPVGDIAKQLFCCLRCVRTQENDK